MNPISRVLTAVDCSESARAAFDHALVLSRTNDAELTVVHAVPKDRPFRWRSRERSSMIAALRQAAEAAGVRFEVSVQHGDPVGVILLHARARRPDLIVLGTHQRTGFLRLGSVAETVTLRATQPVLIVPASPGGRTAESAMSFDSILVAVDFTERSIGRPRRTRLDRIVMASTVSGVLRRARCSVLAVPGPSDVTDVASEAIGAERYDGETIAP